MEQFQQIINRVGTRSVKWDMTETLYKDKEVLPMWVADMDFESPTSVKEALVNRAEHGVFGYTMTDEQLGESIQAWLHHRHQWQIDTKWLTYSPGVVPSLHMIVQALTKPEDSILIQTPIYPPFYDVIRNHNRTVVTNSLKMNKNRYEIDFDDFEEKIKQVKMFILCSPHNPVGRVWTKEELSKMGEICLKHNVVIVADEIHADLIHHSNQHLPLASLSEELSQNTITCMSPAKTFNIPGLQASYVITPNQDFRNKLEKQFSKQGIHMLNIFGIVAMEAAYLHGEGWLNQLIHIVEENKQYVKENLSKKIQVIDSEGTYLLWLDCKKLNLDQKELKLFFQTEAKVGLNSGDTFGEEGIGFMRMNVACPRATLKEGIKRINQALQG